LRYEPAKAHGSYGSRAGDPFASFVADLMHYGVVNFFRSKANGFGDRRHGYDGRIPSPVP
jgi:hypothetical protein